MTYRVIRSRAGTPVVVLGDIQQQTTRLQKYLDGVDLPELAWDILSLIAQYAQPCRRPRFKQHDMVVRHGRPGQPLHIYDPPRWCAAAAHVTGTRASWMYAYDYGLGFTSEGSARECDIRLCVY